jgi:RNA polymerase sigma-70 factor (ECF subfamily)
VRETRSSVDFERTFLKHLDAAYNLARWLTRDPVDAEDVVQEAFMRAYKSHATYRGGDSRAWILKILRNTCYTWLQKNRPREIVNEFDEELHSRQAEETETLLIENIDSQRLKRLLENLPVEFREVVLLRDVEGLSYKEISTVADVPLGTVMSRLARARKKLQSALIELEAGGAK